MERAIIKALEKQYNEILTPLKDSIQKRLNLQVQKLTRRQSTTLYSVPSQVRLYSSVLYHGFQTNRFFILQLIWTSDIHVFWIFFCQLGTFLNTIKRILDILHCRVKDILKSWASYLPVVGDKKSLFGEQMNEVTVLLRTKYKTYLQATVEKLVSNVSSTILYFQM